jgi:hypothetical protein
MLGKPKNPDPQTGVDYETLGRAVETALVKDYVYILHSTRRQIWSSFIRGVFAGLGGVIGATLVVTVLIALLGWLGALPGIGHFFQQLGTQINTK